MNKAIEIRGALLGGIVPHDPMTEEELLAIESDLGQPLPKDCRDFMRTYGGATFGKLVQFRLLEAEPVHLVPNLMGIPIPRYELGPFSHFYGSKSGNQSSAKNIRTFKGRMPDTMIPIADDGGGHQICIGVKGDERGRVYYWDHHNEWDEEDYLEDYGEPMPPEVKFQNVYLIAESFEDFFSRLEVCPD